jgi:hypothetical protein
MIDSENDEIRRQIIDGEFEFGVAMKDMQTGMRGRRNSRNFAVVELEFTADPRKRAPEWEKAERDQYGERVWLREYKMHWIVHEGVRIYPEYFRDIHRAPDELEPWPGIPIVRGWDVGPTNRWFGCVALQIHKTRTRVLREWLEADIALTDFGEAVLSECRQRWPAFPYRDCIDRISFDAKERLTSNQYSTVNALKLSGVRNPKRAASSMAVRHDAIKGALTRLDPDTGKAAYKHDPSCLLIEGGFLGGYHRRKSTTTGQVLEVIEKNEYSHVMDAHQFALCFAKALDVTTLGMEDDNDKPIIRGAADYEVGQFARQ